MAEYSEQEKREHPDDILNEYRRKGRGILSDLFHGPEWAHDRAQIIAKGVVRKGTREVRVATRPIPGTDEHEVIQIAAVSRNVGLTDALIDEIDDFANAQTRQRAQKIDLMWRVYDKEGVINNAINKLCALIAAGGSFKVRKAKKGKKQTALEELQNILDEFAKNVNNAPDDGVVKGARGLKALMQQAVRQALVEGDWIGRAVWTEHGVLNNKGQSASLPMTIQSISGKFIEPVEGFENLGVEAFYWKPEDSFVQQITSPKDKNVKEMVKRYVPKDVLAQLKKDKKYFLDPALLMHVKHRGVDFRTFGESFIEPAMFAIAYRRAIEAVDLTVYKNIINRLTIVMVGNSEPGSPYATAEVQAARAALMQQFFEDPGPNMTIVWQGNDVEVADVGAHETTADTTAQHQIANDKIKLSIGVPDAILSGTNQGDKSSGFAAMLGAAAQLDELQSAFEQTWTTLGERIALENGFTDFEIIYESDNSIMLDRTEEWNQRRLDYTAGVIPIREYLKLLGFDPDAMYLQRCFERGLVPGEALWSDVFMPIAGVPGQSKPGPDGQVPAPPGAGGGPNQGRPPDSVTGKPTPERAPERKTPVENK